MLSSKRVKAVDVVHCRFFQRNNKNGGYMTEEFNPKLQKLKQMQSLPLEQKIIVSKQRIKQWLEAWEDQCVVSFSGGVDSTVLLDLVRSVNPDIKAVFVNTGLEYPQIVKFVKTINTVTHFRAKVSQQK